jgi:CRISPR-associated protein Cas1
MEQGLVLGAEGECLVLKKGEEKIQEHRIREVDQVLLFGGIGITPAAIGLLLRHGVDTVFLTATGRFKGRLVSRTSGNVELRLKQFERLRDPEFALEIAKGMIRGKIANQRSLLLRAQRSRPREDLARAVGELRRLLGLVAEARELESLRGLEGQAGAVYFEHLGLCITNPRFHMAGRSRRPPRDAPNALLSFGYTILGTLMESLVLMVGLDPMLGVFHRPEYGRPSLMLDLIEEFRPVLVDGLMLRMLNLRELAPEDFQDVRPGAEEDALAGEGDHGGPGVWLGPTGRKVFFRRWTQRLKERVFYPAQKRKLALEDIMLQQVYHLARVIRGEERTYVPFIPR